MNEITESLGRSYNCPDDIEDGDLEAELACLGIYLYIYSVCVHMSVYSFLYSLLYMFTLFLSLNAVCR